MHNNWKCLWRYKLLGSKGSFKYVNSIENLRKTRFMCSSPSTEQTDTSLTSNKFSHMLAECRRQAQSSIIVSVSSYYSLFHLCKYVEQFVKIKKIFYWKLNSEKQYFLLECQNTSDIKSLLNECGYLKSDSSLPTCSRLLLYNNSNNDREKSIAIPCEVLNYPLETVINARLLEAENVTQQMIELQKCEQLSEISIRQRFFICSHVENCVNNLFRRSVCLPFGSAVNGFGSCCGDLDMNLNLYSEQQRKTKQTVRKDMTETSELYFFPKRMLWNDRSQLKRMLEALADMFQVFVPGISNMNRILQARVPILKFHHDIIGIQCDMSLNNMSGVYMAEILYLYGEMDYRVKPLVYTIRRWAKKNRLTSDVANSQITNFSLIMMVIFFLQTQSQPKLPPMSHVKKLIDSGGDYKINIFMNSEDADLSLVLKELFAFYAKFNYRKNAMCLVSGTITPKPDSSSIYIHNPIELGLNVSKNVSLHELQNVVAAMENAIWILEESSNTRQSKSWGLLELFNGQTNKKYEQKWDKKFQARQLFDKSQTGAFFVQNYRKDEKNNLCQSEHDFLNNFLEKPKTSSKKSKRNY